MLFSDIDQAFQPNNVDIYNKYSRNIKQQEKYPININEIRKNIIHNPNFQETFHNSQGNFYNAQGNMELNNYYDENMQGTRLDDLAKNNLPYKYEHNNASPSECDISKNSDTLSFIDENSE